MSNPATTPEASVTHMKKAAAALTDATHRQIICVEPVLPTPPRILPINSASSIVTATAERKGAQK